MSGSLGVDVKTGKLVSGGAVAEARQALINMGYILREAGSDYNKGSIYLENYIQFFYFPTSKFIFFNRKTIDETLLLTVF